MRQVSAFLRRHVNEILNVVLFLMVVFALWKLSAPIAQLIRSAPSLDAIAFPQEPRLSLGLVGSCLVLVALLVWLPKWQASGVQDLKDRLTIENTARQTLAQIIGGTLILVGLYFTAETLRTTQEGQITDRFTKATDQLGQSGPEKLAIRLGGIYGLERIAKDSEKDHWPIIEILTIYVKYHANWSFVKEEHRPQRYLPPPDIQAILTVIGRRDRTYGRGEKHPLDLGNTDLRSANLTGAHLEGARVSGAHLNGAILWGTYLEGASLYKTDLKGAYLHGAHLERADLQAAELDGADLREAYLEGAENLTVEQLATAKTLYGAHLDPPLLEQIRQQHPKLLEKPQD